MRSCAGCCVINCFMTLRLRGISSLAHSRSATASGIGYRCETPFRHRVLAGPTGGPQTSFAAVLWPRRAAAAAELVVAATATDKDQCHKPDAQCERDDDPETHRDPTGRTDVRIADAGPQGGNHDTDDQNYSDSDHDRD